MKLHHFAGQVRVWSARLKGEPLVNLVAFKKAVFKDIGGFLKSRFKVCFPVYCHLMLEVTFQFGLKTRGVNSNTCHFCLDLCYIFHECQVFLSTEEFQLLDEIHCFSITLYRALILFLLCRFFSTFSFKDSSHRFGDWAMPARCSDFMNFTLKATIFK